jgi:[ribosomal protein S5]-alanine N-acetyltransferase
MTEAVRAVLAYEFEVRGTLRMFATCETGNVGSARVMEKAGMHYEGTFQGTDFEGNWANRHRYALHAHEYRSRDYGS